MMNLIQKSPTALIIWSVTLGKNCRDEKGYLNSKSLQNKIVLRSWNENESDMAYEYLRQILQSDDLPYALHSVTKKDKTAFII